MAATIDELTVADGPEAWAALGFEVVRDTCVVGDVRIRLAGPGAGKGVIGWGSHPRGGAGASRGDRALWEAIDPPSSGGFAFVATDLDATVAGLGDRVSEIRPAIQPGRRIATLRRSASLAVPVALMTPPPDC